MSRFYVIFSLFMVLLKHVSAQKKGWNPNNMYLLRLWAVATSCSTMSQYILHNNKKPIWKSVGNYCSYQHRYWNSSMVYQENSFYVCATFFAYENRLHQCRIWTFSQRWLWRVLSLLFLLPSSRWFLASPILWLCRWRWHVPLNYRLTFNGLRGVIS
jgi:hypothetical protein